MKTKAKIINGSLLRSKIHQEIDRYPKQKQQNLYDKGYVDALSRIESLIDKMKPIPPEDLQSQTNRPQEAAP